MKNYINSLRCLAIFALLLPLYAFSQSGSSKTIVTKQSQLDDFTELSVKNALTVYLTQGTENQITIEAPAELIQDVTFVCSEDKLTLSLENDGDNRKDSKVVINLTFKNLNTIKCSNASTIKSITKIQNSSLELSTSGASDVYLNFEGPTFVGDFSGASTCKLNLDVETGNLTFVGASNAIVSGNATNHTLKAMGTSDVKAFELITDHTNAQLLGASDAKVFARKSLDANLTGTSNLSFYDNGKIKKITAPGDFHFTFSGMENVKQVTITNDTTETVTDNDIILNSDDENQTIEIGDNEIIIRNDDSVIIRIGEREIRINEDGDFIKIEKNRKHQRFKGHWAGFDLGINGYLTPSGNSDFPSGHELMDLDYANSMVVSINFLELNRKIGTPNFGVVSGMGISWNNYRFEDISTRLVDDGSFMVFSDSGVNVGYDKSKLLVTKLTIPVLFEYQTNSKCNKNSFHVNAGIVGGLRIGSHAKYKFNNGSSQTVKERDDFYLNPFSCDATIRIGWSVINLFATYSLTPMFREHKGPELYPFSAGITLLSF